MTKDRASNNSPDNRPPDGIIAALATPLDAEERIDDVSLARLIEHVMEGGVRGVLVLGATGEAPALSARERRRMVELTVNHVRGRVPVVAGVCETGLSNAIESSRASARAGVAAVLASPPGFFNHAASTLAERYFFPLAEASESPVWIYNAPAHVHTMLNAETIVQLSRHPNIAAVKDSSGDFSHFQDVIARLESENRHAEFAVYQGVGYHLAASARIGARGGIVGLANVMPRFFVTMFEAARSGQLDLADQFQAALMEYRRITASVPHLSIPITKTALEMLGLCSGRTTRPFGEVNSSLRDAMQSFVQRCLQLCEMKPSTIRT